MTKANDNIDYVQGKVFPAQTYAFSGRQWGTSQTETASKKPTDASPMVITSQPPGAFAKTDDNWKLTFGASHDAWLTLFNSAFMANSPASLGSDAFGRGMPKADDFNLYKLANETQQITYIANKNSVEEFRNAPKLANEFAARGLGIRMPMMAAGYGKTVALRPTDPNPTDPRKNDESHKLARETWKHGPLVGRWDSRIAGWSVFNDLITGQGNDSLGTLVHGSNPDETAGFPFLRGKLQDVWWVRKLDAYSSQDGQSDDFTQTGEVLTRLEHQLYDEAEQACAPLNSIFKIPGNNHGGCHPDPEHTTTLGSETTYEQTLIDLKDTVHFNMDDDHDGPINFSTIDISPEAFCNSSAFGYYHRGVVFFDSEGCVWDVAVKLDECDLVGGHLAKLAQNDVAITEHLTYICNFINNWAGGGGAVKIHGGDLSAPDVHDANVASLATAIQCVDGNIPIALNIATQRMQLLDAAVYSAANDYAQACTEALLAAINSWISTVLQPILLECCGAPAAGLTDITLELANAGEVGGVSLPVAEYLDCDVALLPMPRLNCEYCFGVHLNVPCGEDEAVFAGDACFANEPPVPETAYGDCQAHD